MKFLLIILLTFSGLGFAQSIDDYKIKKVSFLEEELIIDSIEWKKGMREWYHEMHPISDTLFKSLDLEKEELPISYDELMDTIKNSSNGSEKYRRYFIYETIN